ncbi:unnamed protein product, partial [Mesorhabditis spiculigera]
MPRLLLLVLTVTNLCCSQYLSAEQLQKLFVDKLDLAGAVKLADKVDKWLDCPKKVRVITKFSEQFGDTALTTNVTTFMQNLCTAQDFFKTHLKAAKESSSFKKSELKHLMHTYNLVLLSSKNDPARALNDMLTEIRDLIYIPQTGFWQAYRWTIDPKTDGCVAQTKAKYNVTSTGSDGYYSSSCVFNAMQSAIYETLPSDKWAELDTIFTSMKQRSFESRPRTRKFLAACEGLDLDNIPRYQTYLAMKQKAYDGPPVDSSTYPRDLFLLCIDHKVKLAAASGFLEGCNAHHYLILFLINPMEPYWWNYNPQFFATDYFEPVTPDVAVAPVLLGVAAVSLPILSGTVRLFTSATTGYDVFSIGAWFKQILCYFL